jgi:hypothetical protein
MSRIDKPFSLWFRLLVAGLLATAWVFPAQAEITTLSSAINKAGRQRMLTQRMVKAYCMIGIQVDPLNAREQLRSSVALFEEQLNELIAFAASDTEKRALQRVQELWQPFKEHVTGPVTREGAQWLLEHNDDLLRAAHKVVLLLQERSGTSYGRLVNVSGRQRMLSQRLSKFYMYRVWGFDSAEIMDEIERAKNEFKGALAELIAAPENTPALKQALEEARKQWRLFKHGLERKEGDYIPLMVAMTGDKLLRTMNDITALYEGLSSR